MPTGPPVPSFAPYVPPPLPPGWTEHQAPGGHTYYYNASTKQSTYTRPLPAFPVPGVMPFVAPGAVIPGDPTPKEKKKERPRFKRHIRGTGWIRVETTEGNVFWTHVGRRESVWEIPEEIKEQAEEIEREERELKAQMMNAKSQPEDQWDAEEVKRKEREEVERVMEEVKDAVAAGKRKAAEPAEGNKENGHKRSRVEEEAVEEPDEQLQQEIADEMAQEGVEEPNEQWQREIADEMAQEAEADAGDAKTQTQENEEEHNLASDEQKSRKGSTAPPATSNVIKGFFKVPDRVDLSIDEAKALFKTLLQEKNINPLLPWDTSLPFFISDPRYVLLPSVSARREAFDEFCRDAARSQRAAKAAAIKEGIGRAGAGEIDKDKEAYASLLKEEVTSTRATWHEFRRKWKKDRRFFGWAGDRERERAFRDWVRDLMDVKKKQSERAEREFFQLLREHKEIKPGDVWKEVKRKINSNDPRYDAVGSTSLREELFVTYVKTVGEQTSHDTPTQTDKGEEATQQSDELLDAEAEAARRKQRAERAERGLREREEKVRRERAGLERELGRTRGAASREEGEREFMTLLTDAVRDPQADWESTVPSLSHDPRFVLCALTLPVQRGLFSAHVTRLRDKHLSGLHALFAAHAPRLDTRWQDLDGSATKAMRKSAVVGRLGLSDPQMDDGDSDSDGGTVRRRRGGGGGGEDALEAEFNRWQRTRNSEARKAFDAMLSENAFLEFWGRIGKVGGDGVGGGASVPDEGDEEEGEEGGGKADLKKLAQAIDMNEVEKVLKNDSRWMAFDYVPDQRERWLRDYMEKLAAPKLSVHVPDKERP